MIKQLATMPHSQPCHTRPNLLAALITLAVLIMPLLIVSGCSLVLPNAPAPQATVAPAETSTASQRQWIMPTSEPADSVGSHGNAIKHVDGVVVSLWAGSGLRGGTDGPGREAQFDGPIALALDPEGYLLVAEHDSGRIRLIDQDGFVRSWIGDSPQTDGLSPSLAPLGQLNDLTISPTDGSIYLTDDQGRLLAIRDRAHLEVLVDGPNGFGDGALAQAALRHPQRMVLGPGDTVYLTDGGNHRLRLYDPAGQLYTVAGDGSPGHRDGPVQQAQLNWPNGLAIDARGQLYIGDGGTLGAQEEGAQAAIRNLSHDGQLLTVAGGQTRGHHDGSALQARFQRPLSGMDMDSQGNLYVADTNNHAIRVLTPAGEVLTVAGNGQYGLREGSGAECMLGLPIDVAWDGQSGLWVADYGQQVIWHIALDGTALLSD